ncbi:hypothetical protein [Erythrobacter aureus]|uniref:hypothetical protein n=1 Tax=Erythrobacter aureus TaxID=2182384 RepID=UPI003A9474AD
MAGRKDPPHNSEHHWEGLQEIDRAISENRLTSYSWKKAWADPLGRAKIITVLTLLVAFVIFVIVYDLVL